MMLADDGVCTAVNPDGNAVCALMLSRVGAATVEELLDADVVSMVNIVSSTCVPPSVRIIVLTIEEVDVDREVRELALAERSRAPMLVCDTERTCPGTDRDSSVSALGEPGMLFRFSWCSRSALA